MNPIKYFLRIIIWITLLELLLILRILIQQRFFYLCEYIFVSYFHSIISVLTVNSWGANSNIPVHPNPHAKLGSCAIDYHITSNIKANSHTPYSSHAVSLPCHAAPMPFSDSAVSFVKVRVASGNIRNASPTV
jgi:hypothetical protein